jgi:hypothetical protein
LKISLRAIRWLLDLQEAAVRDGQLMPAQEPTKATFRFSRPNDRY